MDQAARDILTRKHIPGAAILVLSGDEVVYEGYHGLADIERNVPVSEKSVFAIASMSKAFTAAALLLLEQDGLVDLDESVRKYLPQVPDTWIDITVRQLMNHTSGLPDDWELHDWGGKDQFFLLTDSDDGFLKALMEQPLAFRPGSEWRYSCGPFVAGLIAEAITGQSLEDVLQERVFRPLGMTSTYLDDPRRVIPHRVSGYLGTGPEFRHGFPISAAAHRRADVGIVTTARDMALWVNALRDGSLLGEAGTTAIFSTATLQDGTPTPAALGWFVTPRHGTRTIGHAGDFRTGFSSQVDWYPDEDLVSIFLTNQGEDRVSFRDSQQLLGCIDETLAPVATRARENAPDFSRLERIAGAISAAGSGLDHELLHPNFPRLFYSRFLRKQFASVLSVELIGRETPTAPMQVFGHSVRERLICQATADPDFFTTLYLDDKGRIVFMDWPE